MFKKVNGEQVEMTAAEEAELERIQAEDAGLSTAEIRVAEIDVELTALDAAAIRPLRAVLAARQAEATPASEDVAMLASLESRAVALRVERAGLIE